MDLSNMIKDIAEKNIKAQTIRNGDYYDYGVLHCGKCKKPRQMWRDFNGIQIFTACECDCDIEEQRKREQEEKENRRKAIIESKRRKSGIDERYRNTSFANSVIDADNEKIVKALKRYCDKFEEMKNNSQGLLIYGDVGTGKTHLAMCIANELIEQEKDVYATKFVDILEKMKGYGDEEEEYMIDFLNRQELLIMDDLGTERCTDYALEKLYKIVDERYRSKLPVIFTTNMNLEQMKVCQDMRYKRIFDRIFEMCFPIEIKGTSFRKKEAAKRYEDMKNKLFSEE